MRFTLPALVAALATTCVADELKFWEEYWGWRTTSSARFYTTAGAYDVDGHSGCYGTSVPGMVEFCVDWPQKRGHFKFSHQDYKRCMVQTRESGTYSCAGGHLCKEWVMSEAPCTW